jgi:predicted secreted protein
MSKFTIFGIFFIMWWIVFFIVLPLNITTHMDKGINIKGMHGSVPINPKLVYKLIVTTIVTFIILLSLVFLFHFDILTMNKILSLD